LVKGEKQRDAVPKRQGGSNGGKVSLGGLDLREGERAVCWARTDRSPFSSKREQLKWNPKRALAGWGRGRGENPSNRQVGFKINPTKKRKKKSNKAELGGITVRTAE